MNVLLMGIFCCACLGKDCIKCEDQWFTPYAFEEFAGKAGFAGSCKKWKMTIFHKTKPLQYWFEVRQSDLM